MHILLFIFIIIIAIFIFGISIIASIVRKIFGFGLRRPPFDSDQQSQQSTYNHTNAPENAQKKIFSKEDGEYVDFEEIKEEEKK